ncbi:MAG: hypothetical protein ACJ766_04670 [Thermoleophilaceae bacterium]
MKATYIKPTVTDYGNLVDLTAATDYVGPEDGANKLILPHHS